MALLNYIKEQGIDAAVASSVITLAEGGTAELYLNPNDMSVEVSEQQTRSLILLHQTDDAVSLSVDVAPFANIRIVEVLQGRGCVDCMVRQQAGSRCEIYTILLGDATADYTVDLNGKEASNLLRGAFVAGGDERQRMGVRVNHFSSDCQSDSLIKGVAGGKALGEFNGMVYVAQDAQRTDARQTSRNIEIGREAHIVTKPQLEIYADDVKCSHGATVGQLDGEAVLYMRQRGLSEAQAKRLQIEGFLKDVVMSLGELGEVLADELTAKLETL